MHPLQTFSRRIIITLLVPLLWFTACNLPQEPKSQTGTLSVTLLGADEGRMTFQDYVGTLSLYLNGTGPGTLVEQKLKTGENRFSIAPGNWTLTLSVKNSGGETVADDTKTVLVEAGKIAQVNFVFALTNPDPETYLITFDPNGGVMETATLRVPWKDANRNPTLNSVDKKLPAPPAKSGEFFVNWLTENGEEFTEDVPVSGDITVYAQWSKVGHTVSFNSNGGTAVSSQTVGEGGKARQPEDPARENWGFDAWYTDETFTTKYDFDAFVTEDIILYAQWLPLYAVRFDSKGGSAVADQRVKQGDKVIRPENPTRDDGMAFVDWYAEESLNVQYDFNQEVTSNITLYAKWSAVTHAVTFNSNGGTEIPAQTIGEGGKARQPEDPTRDNHVFAAWHADEALINEYNFDTAVTADITLHAKWLPLYTVRFDSKGGSAVTTQRVKQGDKVIRPVNPTHNDNLAFVAWYADGDLTREYDFDTAVTADIDLYAMWSVVAYTVTFNSNGGTEIPTQTIGVGGKAAKPENPTHNTGLVFGSWYVNEDLTQEYNFDAAVAADITLYAKWLEPQAPLSITGIPATLRYGDSPFSLGTSGGSGIGEVSYTVTDGQDVISVIGDRVTVLNAGSAVITASKAGDADYAPAMSPPLTVTAEKANFSFSISSLAAPFTPLAGENSAAVTMSPVGLQNGDTEDTITYTAEGFTITGSVMTYDGVTAFPAGPGGISVTVTGNAGSNYNPATSTISSVTVYDGQADYLAGDTHDRRISVTQANIEAFNTYALSAAGETGHYKLTQNAVLSEPAAGEDNWRPITDFTGSFDGGAFTIENLTVYEADYSVRGSNGMFFRILDGGVVKNLTLTDCDISGASAGGIAGANNGTIENCSVTGIVKGSVVGGITGENQGTIQYSSFTGIVEGVEDAGGLAGTNDYPSTIKSSWSAATVISANGNAGGIVGVNATSAEVQGCYATGDVSATSSYSGGIIGYNGGGRIYHCYATGIIKSEGEAGYAGGVAGYNTGSFGPLGEIHDSIALNPRVTTNGKGNGSGNVVGAGVRRVIGEFSGNVAYNNNYGRSDMTVENFYGPCSPAVNDPADLDGGTITSANWGSQTWWTGTARFEATVWDFNGISATILPKLRNAAGIQNPVLR